MEDRVEEMAAVSGYRGCKGGRVVQERWKTGWRRWLL